MEGCLHAKMICNIFYDVVKYTLKEALCEYIVIVCLPTLDYLASGPFGTFCNSKIHLNISFKEFETRITHTWSYVFVIVKLHWTILPWFNALQSTDVENTNKIVRTCEPLKKYTWLSRWSKYAASRSSGIRWFWPGSAGQPSLINLPLVP